VHTQFVESTGHATNQMRQMAATLRAHANNVIAAEQDFAV